MKRVLNRLFVLSSCLLTTAIPALAQHAGTSSASTISEAIEAIQNGNTDAALDPLEDIFETEPGWYSEQESSLAYWLGEAYYTQGFAEDAREVWELGAEALEEQNIFDVSLETALLTATFANEWREDYPINTTRYLRILEHLDSTQSLSSSAHFAPYLEALRFVLPESLKKDLGLHDVDDISEYSWSPYTSSTLITWWRSQDPAPATRINELLLEHLQRVAYASKYYVEDGQFDDRGMIYIRLGKPDETTRVQFDKTSFRNKVTDRSLTINESDFPDNEFWYYKYIDNSAHYLFHDKFGTFRIGEINDLIPSSIRSGLGSSARGQTKAKFLIRTMEEIYRQLSLYHQDYTLRYQEIASFSGMIDEAELAAETAALGASADEQIEEEGDGDLVSRLANLRGDDFSDTGLPGSSFNPNRPDLFIQSAMASDKASEELQIANREEYVPQVRSSVFDELLPLPLLIRSARFLDEDGTTRTEIYWAASKGSLALDERTSNALLKDGYTSDDYLAVVSTVQKAPDYTERVVNYERKLLKDIGDGEEVSIGNQTAIVRGDTGLYHVAVQWDQYVALLDETGSVREIGPHVKANVYRQDSLQALISDGVTLEMSDLKPMIVPDFSAQTELTEGTLNTAIPYPSSRITPDTPVMLYFELYHLAYTEEDLTRYSIEYTIQEKRNGGLRLGRKRQAATSFKSTQEGTERSTFEQLVIDLSEWRDNGDIDITVTVTDEVTQQQVSRSLSYTLTSEL